MKRISLLLCAIAFCAAAAMAAGRPVGVKQMPKTAQTFINDYWPRVAVLHVEREDGRYNAMLEDGTAITFNRKGQWLSIDNEYGFPNHFLPEGIGDFIRRQYPDSYIAHVSRHAEGHTVVLNTGLELHYDRYGHIQRVDD
ncbi:MAG: hypothetical protein AUK63_488 [bacterium P3]|nr:MAG: hypothetical protein AUK63_488 [bacterium P3]KWW41944.1 MAG: hypothetical protein F083_595 [bacterium F083]